MILEDLNENFGKCICNDIDYEDAEFAKDLVKLVADEKIVCIRNTSKVEPKKLVTLYKNMGRVAAQNEKVRGSGVGGFGELVQVKSDGLFQGAEDGELIWHNAILNKHSSESIVGMYMHHLADEGGDTYFSDAESAYNDLDDDLKEKLETLQSKTIYYPLKDEENLTGIIKNTHINQIFPDEDTFREWKDVNGNVVYKKQEKTKPVVTVHPTNRRKGLFFPFVMLRGFVGMPKKESDELFQFLTDHVMKEKYVYRHKWSKYDICLSDQIHSLHKRDAFTGYRELWRAAIWLD